MAAKLPKRDLPWPITWECVMDIALGEACYLSPYRCPAGVPTQGWGETEGVSMSNGPWTQEYADQRLCDSLTIYTQKVRDICKVVPSENELSALVSFSYNVGITGLKNSSIMRAHNAGDRQSASRAFGLYNKARVNGVLTVLRGLTRRRAIEAALYLKPSDDAPVEHMPQAVAVESSMAKSPITQSGAVTAGAGAVTLLSSLNDTVAPVTEQVTAASSLITSISDIVKTVSDTLHVTPGVLLACALLVAGLVVVYHRLNQRNQGWV